MTFKPHGLIVIALLLIAHTALPRVTTAAERSPEEAYRQACSACHGNDGKGAHASTLGHDLPLPDFTDCNFATREPATDWFAIAHAGGPVRAFDRKMPAFGEALTEREIEGAIEHIRGFCPDRAWPRGDLNLPRPLITEKAFPEDEAVLTTTFDTSDDRSVTTQLLYEHRVGARTQFEIAVPLSAHRSGTERWSAGMGDIALAVKRVLTHSLERGHILSLSGEMVLPTGSERRGFGKGTTVFEPFLTFGQLLPSNMFVHAQAGAEVPADADLTSEGFWRAAVGRTLEQARFGRSWSPMVELLGARELERGAQLQWDIVPQMQVTLSRRQHIMVNAGVRVPLSQRDSRHAQVIAYFLWDWFDGGLLEGWR